MKRITITVVVTDKDAPSVAKAAKALLPTWIVKVEDIKKVPKRNFKPINYREPEPYTRPPDWYI